MAGANEPPLHYSSHSIFFSFVYPVRLNLNCASIFLLTTSSRSHGPSLIARASTRT